jgi:imidazolonepropionase
MNASQLVTLAGTAGPRVGPHMEELGIVLHGGMLCEDGLIIEVGTSAAIERSLNGEEEVIDATGKVVLPGWVDAHTHAVFAGNRLNEFEMRCHGATYEQIAEAGGGIRATVRAVRAASEDELVEQGKTHAKWFLDGGTTTIECKSGYGLSVEDELKMLRAIGRLNRETRLEWVPTFLGAHAFPPEFDERRDDYVRLVCDEMLPAISEGGLAEFCDIFVERNYFTSDQARTIISKAKALGLGIRMHVDQLTNGNGAALAAELGAATADHLEQTDERGIEALRRANVIPVLVPGSVYALGLRKYPDARTMIRMGLPVVLATDFNPGSSPTPSMQMILSLACTHMGMSPAECITAATINAAHSLNRAHDRGSLECGKRADFHVYDCKDYRELIYYFGVKF